MAIRTCSTRTAMTMANGSTRTMTILTTGGIVVTGSRSPSRNSLHFLSCFVGEFSFLSFPLHPPRFLPTSSTPCAIRIYCLLVSDLFSHNTSNNTCIVSSFRIAYRTYGNFSSRIRNPAVATASIVSINNESILHPNECRCGFGRMW